MGLVDDYMRGSGLELQGLKNAYQAQQYRDEMGQREMLQNAFAQQQGMNRQNPALEQDFSRMGGGGDMAQLQELLRKPTSQQQPAMSSERLALDYWRQRDPERAMKIQGDILTKAKTMMELGGDPKRAFEFYTQATGEDMKYLGSKGDILHWQNSDGTQTIYNWRTDESQSIGEPAKEKGVVVDGRLLSPTTALPIGGGAQATDPRAEFQRAIAGLTGRSQAPDTMQRSQNNFGYAPFTEVSDDIRMAGADYGVKTDDIKDAVKTAEGTYDKTRFPVSGKVGRTDWTGTQNLLGDVNKDAASTAPVVKVNLGGDKHRDFKDESSMRKEFLALPEVKDFPTIEQNAKRALKALGEQGKGSNVAVDQSIITVFNKMLDPSSVVRESEYARTPQDLSILSRIRGKWDKVQNGGAGLDAKERQALYRMINNFNGIANEQYNAQVDFYSGLAGRYGFKPENIVRLGGKRAEMPPGSASPKTAGSATQPQRPLSGPAQAVLNKYRR